MMDYLRIPSEIKLVDIRAKDLSFSPSMYRRVAIRTSAKKTVRDLLNLRKPYEKGTEPGSMYYMADSTRYLIRTKALQSHSTLIYPKGDAIIPVNPRIFKDIVLSDGDILMSKDSNIGECAMVDGDYWKDHMFSGGIVRLHPTIDRYYFFAFLKHPLFKTQLRAKSPRGATLRHAKTLWLDCFIPIPNQKGVNKVIKYVSALMEAIIEKEKAIKQRNLHICDLIERELTLNRHRSPFKFSFPTIERIRTSSRLDTGLYCVGFRAFKHWVDDYKFGSTTLSEMGVKARRGPNLAVSVIGKSLYSEGPKSGWYELIRPVNISEYGTLTRREWLGTSKKLPIVNRGDLILGCEGFGKGRSIILIDDIERCTTNFHGTVIYWPGAEIWETVFLRCFLAVLRKHGVIDWVGVGGSGGHMSPEYFDYLPFPKFPEKKKAEIAGLYHKPIPPPKGKPKLGTFVEWHSQWNKGLGIWELDREMKLLQKRLAGVQKHIIEGKTVKVPF